MKKISIIVPVYNVEKYIDKCLNSLVNQTLKNIEIIVVNDGSPDNSQKIIDKYVKKYPTLIKSYIKENGGQGSARNYGLEKSNGEYIMYVDSDDYIEPNMAELMYTKAKKEFSDIVVCGNYVVDEENRIIKEERSHDFDKSLKKENFLFGKMAVWNKIYKRNLLIDNNLTFRSKLWYEDLDFTIKVFSLTDKISYVDDLLYNYLLRDGSTMNNSNAKRNLELCDAFDSAIDFLKKNKLNKKMHSEIEFLCIYHMYICGITRVININCNNKLKNQIIDKFKKYMIVNFPEYRKNKYIKQLDFNKKLIYFLIKYKLNIVINFIFKIKKG